MVTRILAVAVAAVLLALAVAEAPHTVHHFFEGGGEASPECAFASTADHNPATATPVELADALSLIADPVPAQLSLPRPSLFIGVSPARAPPASAV